MGKRLRRQLPAAGCGDERMPAAGWYNAGGSHPSPRGHDMSGKLRYGLTQLWPSEIGDQLYCEYKVHLRRTHPEVRLELPSLEQGEEHHAALASQAVPVTREEIERSIREGKKLALS